VEAMRAKLNGKTWWSQAMTNITEVTASQTQFV
jgi:hypothetical protein